MKQSTENTPSTRNDFFFVGETQYPLTQFEEVFTAQLKHQPLPAPNLKHDKTQGN